MEGFGHHILGHGAVFLQNTGKHIPLSAVLNRRVEQVSHQPSFERFVKGFQNAFKKVIGFFKFIPKQRVVLGKLKGFKVEPFHYFYTGGIQRSKHPTASALLLIGNFSALRFVGKAEIVAAADIIVKRCVLDAALGDSPCNNRIRRVCTVVAFKLF